VENADHTANCTNAHAAIMQKTASQGLWLFYNLLIYKVYIYRSSLARSLQFYW